jgi:hypothetical protein
MNREELTMPDLTRCVRKGDKVFCLDRERKKIVELRITDIPFSECSEDVLTSLLFTEPEVTPERVKHE